MVRVVAFVGIGVAAGDRVDAAPVAYQARLVELSPQ